MIASPDLWLLMIEQAHTAHREAAQRERVARMIRKERRQRRVSRFYCAFARYLIDTETMILNRFEDEPAAWRQRRV